MTEKLVSTKVLRERIVEMQERVAAQRPLRAADDPFFKHAEWLIAEWDAAIRAAEREFVTTERASDLTGWDEQTLRKRARAVREGRPLPAGWEGLLARFDAGSWSFCLSTIPMKGSRAA